MAVSAKVKNSPTSIVVLLLIWIIIVIVIPHTGAMLFSEQLTSFPAKAEIDTEANKVHRATWDSFPEEYNGPFDGNDVQGWTLNDQAARAAHFARENIYDNYRAKKISSVEDVRKFARISPSAVYQYASEEIAGTGLEHVKYFLKWIKIYQQNLWQFFIAQDRKDPESWHLYYTGGGESKKPFNPDNVPMFYEPPMRLSEGIREAAYDILLLILFNVVMFVTAFVSFLRYDVR